MGLNGKINSVKNGLGKKPVKMFAMACITLVSIAGLVISQDPTLAFASIGLLAGLGGFDKS